MAKEDIGEKKKETRNKQCWVGCGGAFKSPSGAFSFIFFPHSTPLHPFFAFSLFHYTMTLFEAHGISMRLNDCGRWLFKDINVKLNKKGEILVLQGPSGTG